MLRIMQYFAVGNGAFDNKVVKTDDVAFGNEIALTDIALLYRLGNSYLRFSP